MLSFGSIIEEEPELGTLFSREGVHARAVRSAERDCFWHLENCIASTLSWILYIQVNKGQR